MKNALLVIVVLVVGCAATPPEFHDFQKTWTMPCSFDEAWSATVQLFAERTWPITTLEKDSGIIVSDWVRIGTADEYADCGTPGLAAIRHREVAFNVFIRDDEAGPSLTVNTRFRELRDFERNLFYEACTSRGTLEAEVHTQILERVR